MFQEISLLCVSLLNVVCSISITYFNQQNIYIYVSFSRTHLVVNVKALCLRLHKQPHLEMYWNTVYKPSDVVESP